MDDKIDLYCYEKLPPDSFSEELTKKVTKDYLVRTHMQQYYLNRLTENEKKELMQIERQRQMKNKSSSKKVILQKR